MQRRVISVDIERAPVEADMPEDEEHSLAGLIKFAKAAGRMLQKTKDKLQKTHEAFKAGMHEAKATSSHLEVMSYLDEAERHMESLEKGMSKMQWMGNQQQQQGHYMPIHAMQQEHAMYSVGGPQYYRM